MSEEYSVSLQKAIEKLANIRGLTLSEEQLQSCSIEIAKALWEASSQLQTTKAKKEAKQLSLMMQDLSGKAFTTYLSDRCFRSSSGSKIIDECIYLLRTFGIPKYFSPYKRLQLLVFSYIAPIFPKLSASFLEYAIRKEAQNVVLFGTSSALARKISQRKKEGALLNVNHLGEAILGEKECQRRLSVYIHDLESTDVECISVKISTLYSQIHLLDQVGTMQVLKERLRQLYRAAMKGGKEFKFINLDMEEHKDLRLTKDLFMQVLSEEEFLSLSAGIALQAYLPVSFSIQREITQWAQTRIKNGGAPVKIRLVKGANLAMEKVEASLRKWPQAPYLSKEEVDANYKKMVRYGCEPSHLEAVHLGIASHNVFDIAHALVLGSMHKVESYIQFEMLEGMADSLRKALQKLAGSVLLYAPTATKEDFSSAIAYLIRRLDENTGADNFLRCSFGLSVNSSDWEKEEKKFQIACNIAKAASEKDRRVQNRFDPPSPLSIEDPFENEPDTDFSLEANQVWAQQIAKEWENKEFEIIPCVIQGQTQTFIATAEGIDPSSNKPCYRYCLADSLAIEQAIVCAKEEEKSWSLITEKERGKLLSSIAQKLRERRNDLIGAMMRDGGKTIVEADPEVSEAIDFAEYYLRSMQQLYSFEDIQWQPKGTILVTPPWNFPISIPAGGILAALAMGNCVIFKPAPEAVLCGFELVKVFWEAGISQKVLQFVTCADEPEGSLLIKDPRINAVILTGATETARLFMKMRPSLTLSAETGGKNALIITALSDRDLAIKDLVQSAFGHAGQKCSAASLGILEAEVYDDPRFLEQLKDATESLHVGSVWDLSVKVPPVIREPKEQLLRALTTLEEGESWLVKPKQDPDNPHIWSPGIKMGVSAGSFLHQTECFGPVLALMRAKDLTHAIELANSTPYGLTSGIHSLDEREINYWLQHIEAGNLYANRSITGAIVQRQSFGGCKASSFGLALKAGGPNYLLCCANAKQVALPMQRSSPLKEAEKLMELCYDKRFSAEEMGLWYASSCSYAYFSKKLIQEYDVRYPANLVDTVLGQDNVLYYTPRKRLACRIQNQDTLCTILQLLSAVLSVGVSIDISFDRRQVVFDRFSKEAFPSLRFIQESEEAFLGRLSEYERIRMISSPSGALQNIAAERGCFLDIGEPLANGRFELIRYMREVSLSYDYHRYGNLGIREEK